MWLARFVLRQVGLVAVEELPPPPGLNDQDELEAQEAEDPQIVHSAVNALKAKDFDHKNLDRAVRLYNQTASTKIELDRKTKPAMVAGLTNAGLTKADVDKLLEDDLVDSMAQVKIDSPQAQQPAAADAFLPQLDKAAKGAQTPTVPANQPLCKELGMSKFTSTAEKPRRKADLQILMPNAVKANGQNKPALLAFNGPLFSGPPKVDDVRQGGLGDCYLGSSLCLISHFAPEVHHQLVHHLSLCASPYLYRP